MKHEILQKEALHLSALAKTLQKLGKKEERAEIQNKLIDYSKDHARLKEEQADKMEAELRALDIVTLNQEQIIQIIDILPQDLSELKSVFAGSKTILSPEQFAKIMEICNSFRK